MRFAAALPILPGMDDRVRNFGKELEEHRSEWERLNEEGTFTSYDLFFQETPMGNTAILVFDVDDPSKIRQTFTDSPHDRWWVDWVKSVHGFDIEQPGGGPATNVFSWRS